MYTIAGETFHCTLDGSNCDVMKSRGMTSYNEGECEREGGERERERGREGEKTLFKYTCMLTYMLYLFYSIEQISF